MQLSQLLTICFPISRHQFQKTAAKFRHLFTLTLYMTMSRSSKSSRNRSRKIQIHSGKSLRCIRGSMLELLLLSRAYPDVSSRPSVPFGHCHLHKLEAFLLASLGPNKPDLVFIRYVQKKVLLLLPTHPFPEASAQQELVQHTCLLLRRRSSTSSLPGESLDRRISQAILREESWHFLVETWPCSTPDQG